MKRLIFLLFLSLSFSVCMFSQPADPEVVTPQIPSGIFETFLALVAFIPVVVEFLKRLIIPNATGFGVQIFSWTIGILITLAGWLLNLGFLNGLSWWMALLYGAGACLAANGIFDTGLITAIFSLFGKKTSN
jgi:hypothetical protein